jgi:uncharacterized protein
MNSNFVRWVDDLKGVGSLSKYFVLTFVVTWGGSALALQGDFAVADMPSTLLRVLLLAAATFAPSLVAIALTAYESGLTGVRALLSRLFRVCVAMRWYVFALCYEAVIAVVALCVLYLYTGKLPLFRSGPDWRFAAGLAIGVVVQAGEEIGWRGYALPRLGRRFGFAHASLVLGIIWALWHLPLYYNTSAEVYGQSFPTFVLLVVAMSVVMTWLYVNTNGSLLLAALMHWAVNHTSDILDLSLPAPGNPMAWSRSPEVWLYVALWWIGAAYFLIKLRQVDAER